MYIQELEGRYSVGLDDRENGWEEVFDSVNEAINFYLIKRAELKYGDDYNRQNVVIEDENYEHYSFINLNPFELIFVTIVLGYKVAVEVETGHDEQTDLIKRNENNKIGIWNPIQDQEAKEIINELLKHNFNSKEPSQGLLEFEYTIDGKIKKKT